MEIPGQLEPMCILKGAKDNLLIRFAVEAVYNRWTGQLHGHVDYHNHTCMSTAINKANRTYHKCHP